MDLDLTGKHALVCGASEGIGRAAARELAPLGADVTLLARRAEVLRERGRTNCRAAHAPGSTAGSPPTSPRPTPARAGRSARRRQAGAHPGQQHAAARRGGPVHRRRDRRVRAPRSASTCSPTRCSCRPCCRACARDGYGRIVNVISTSVKEPIAGLGVSNTIRGAVASWAKTLATRTRRRRHHRQQRAARLHAHAAPRPDPRRPRASDRPSRRRDRAGHARDGAGGPLRRGRGNRRRDRLPVLARPRRTSTASTCRSTAAARARCEPSAIRRTARAAKLDACA